MSDIEAWYKSLPSLTRYYLTGAVGLTTLTSLQVVSPYALYFDLSLIFTKLEIWRLLTTFLYFGNFSFNFLIAMVILVRFCKSLEVHPKYENDFASLIYCVGFLAVSIVLLSFLHKVFFMGPSLLFGMLYVWSKYEPQTQVPFWGGFVVKGYQLPFVLMGLRLLMGSDLMDDVVGLAAGQAYFWLKETAPQKGWNLLSTPEFLNRRLNSQAQSQSFRAYQGRGMRAG